MENHHQELRNHTKHTNTLWGKLLLSVTTDGTINYHCTSTAQWLRRCATTRKFAGSIPAGVSGFFIDIKSFRSHYGPGVDTASNRNEYREYFLGGKGDRCVRLTTLPPSCAVVTKSGSLNFLEPSGPVQACNGTFTFLLQRMKCMPYSTRLQNCHISTQALTQAGPATD